MAAALDQIPAEILADYSEIKILPDGTICGLHRFLFTWGLIIGIDPSGYADRYCYHSFAAAAAALAAWDGEGEPIGWHRHPVSGRRRDLETGREWIAR